MSERKGSGADGSGPGRRARPAGDSKTEARRLSRRRFMAVLAAGAAGVAAAPIGSVAAPASRKKAPGAGTARTPAIEKGIAEQQGSLAQQLKVLRDYPLPPGSNPAFVFAPLARRRRAARGEP